MITLDQLVKQYPTRQGLNTVLNGINLNIMAGEKIGILGRNGAGKSTLIRLISGAEHPTRGHVRRTMSVSWPLAFTGAFQGSLSGLDNLRFICRIYGKDWKERVGYVEDFAELGRYLREPLKNYSAGMTARLAFAISMSIEFDCFLIDETISVGDRRFQDKCHTELFEKRKDRALIMVSHEAHNIRDHCRRGCVINNGKLHEFDEVDSAYAYYNENC
ncbi:ABC transporter ATP-binding protein [Sapientia aquatica]|jgi:capsular polysaccharide transport system ATP-binding protein|uniref:ABC transporter ATP-binding protein n=1 Tax=Sapientia aquatica TaxID=1549640 RepID=A0A4R5VST1_9BURK|nr:ABC transporter ATP-binding protein [Sapientia aquatica]TDK61954.1 ABC transporter ATP-binding protein [Sapientia aquatica]